MFRNLTWLDILSCGFLCPGGSWSCSVIGISASTDTEWRGIGTIIILKRFNTLNDLEAFMLQSTKGRNKNIHKRRLYNELSPVDQIKRRKRWLKPQTAAWTVQAAPILRISIKSKGNFSEHIWLITERNWQSLRLQATVTSVRWFKRSQLWDTG